jgi:hypothetical protein
VYIATECDRGAGTRPFFFAAAEIIFAPSRRKGAAGLDKKFFRRTGDAKVNPHTQQKSNFCARQHMAAGLALYICPERPGAAS